MRSTILIAYALLFTLPSVACDDSNSELQRTQQILQQLTHERDDLKARLERSEAKVAELQQQIESFKSSAAAATASRGEGASTKETPPPRGRSRPTPADRAN
jgi:peptidoglycan hydrolase CwlO-like protein